MCTCGCFKRKREQDCISLIQKTLKIHFFHHKWNLFEVRDSHFPKLPTPAKEYYKSLSFFDTDFCSSFYSKSEAVNVCEAQNKVLWSYKMSSLKKRQRRLRREWREKLFHRMFVSSDDDKKKFVIPTAVGRFTNLFPFGFLGGSRMGIVNLSRWVD